MPGGAGGRRARDPNAREEARRRARTERRIPAAEWEPPALYAASRRTWFVEDYDAVRDPVLRGALEGHARSVRLLDAAMRDRRLSRQALAAAAEVSVATSGQVFRGEVWPTTAVMARLCAAVGLPYGAGQGFVPPDRADPVVASLRARARIAGLSVEAFAAEAGLGTAELLRIIAAAQAPDLDDADRIADALDARR